MPKKQSNVKWRSQMAMLAVENIHESIYWLDFDGRILYVNPAAERELGYSAEELMRMRVSDIDPNVPQEMWGEDGEIFHMLEDGNLHNMETQHRHRDGHLISVEINSSSFEYEGVLYSMAICRDITQRKRMESLLHQEKAEQAALIRKLEDTQKQLLQSEKLAAIGQLAAGVAHEINNPMGYIRSNLATLRGYAADLIEVINAYQEAESFLPADAAVRNRIDKAKQKADLPFLTKDMSSLIAESIDGAERVRRIIQDLKDFSRQGDSDWERVDLHECLESAVNMVWNEIKYKVELVRDYGKLPPIECIPSRLSQVFVNLLVNAAQAIPERGSIAISTRSLGDHVEIAIADTGTGIPADAITKVFDPFFTTKAVGKGTGLGLSVSHGIVQNHGGEIDVVSQEDHGTTFTVRLPVEPPKDRKT